MAGTGKPDDMSNAFEHVKDATSFHLPASFNVGPPGHEGQLSIPQPNLDFKIPGSEYDRFTVTKFMVLEVIVALIIIAIFVPLAQKIKKGGTPKGRIWNFFEAMLLFMRDEVVRPAIGGKEADKFLPFIWTIFFFVLGCNLLGMVPWLGSATGALSCTLVLALMTFGVVCLAGMKKYGVVGFWIGQVPHMELPFVLAIFIKPMIFVIEIGGMFIKHFILAVRLLANMFAGHLVLGVILFFIVMTAEQHIALHASVAFSSVFGATCLSLLELFVAFLQAYIFAFLSALFIGMAVHQH